MLGDNSSDRGRQYQLVVTDLRQPPTNRISGDAERQISGTHVVLGTGQVGHAVARLLCARNADVRVANRSGTVPEEVRTDVKAVGADVSNPNAARRACEGASVVYFCLQPPYDEWADLFPPLLDGAIAAAEAADARFVMADNLYTYGPVSGPIHEDLDATASTGKGAIRAEMARTVRDAHENGRIRAAIGRASDFYGPGVTTSIVGEQVFRKVIDGGTVWFPGDPDVPHTYTYIHDFARALVTLGAHERALGEVWHVPNARTLTTRQFVTLAGDVAGTDPTVRRLPSWLVRPLGAVSQTLDQLTDTQYQRSKPFVVDSTKFERAFGVGPIPHRQALERTIEWYRTDN